MKSMSYLIDHILYQIFKTPLKYLKNHGKNSANPARKIYINKKENRIMSKIKTTYYLKLLMPETMKLLGSTKSKISQDKKLCLIQKLLK